MSNEKFLVIGNRSFVFEYLTQSGFLVEGIAFKGSYFESHLETLPGFPKAKTFHDKQSLNDQLFSYEDFDVLITNGCPFKISSNVLEKHKDKILVNIHPSYLPELRGADPQVGSILFGLNSGATCHVLSSKIDEGDIISQIQIPFTSDLDISLLYRLGFDLEVEVLKKAMISKWAPKYKQKLRPQHVYYTVDEQDRILDFKDSATTICRQIRAFSNASKGCICWSAFDNSEPIILDMAEPITNPHILEKFADRPSGEALIIYENKMLIKVDGGVIKAWCRSLNLSKIKEGNILIGK